MAGKSCVRFSRAPSGAVGCTVGLAPHVYVGAYGEDAAEALSAAGALAAQLQAIVDKNPEVAAALALVPGGAAAFGALAAASELYKSGASVKDVQKSVGPVAAKIVKRLLSLF